MAEGLKGRGLDREVGGALEKAIREIARAAHAEKVLLFGSYATGEAGAESDIDLIVIAKTRNRWRLASKLYLLWHELRKRWPVLPRADIWVLTPRQFAQQAKLVGFIPYEAQRTGVVVYERAAERAEVVAEG